MATPDKLPLTLIIITPQGKYDDIMCESITLTVHDDINGKGGGSYGIRKGHIASVLALDKGIITASTDGRTVFSEAFTGGIAQINKNTVTVTITK